MVNRVFPLLEPDDESLSEALSPEYREIDLSILPLSTFSVDWNHPQTALEERIEARFSLVEHALHEQYISLADVERLDDRTLVVTIRTEGTREAIDAVLFRILRLKRSA